MTVYRSNYLVKFCSFKNVLQMTMDPEMYCVIESF